MPNSDIFLNYRESEELKACTFKPETNHKSNEIAASQSNYKDKEKFYERLHKESEVKNQYMRGL